MTTNYLVVIFQRLLALDNRDTLLSPLNNFKVSMMSMITFKYQILNIRYLLIMTSMVMVVTTMTIMTFLVIMVKTINSMMAIVASTWLGEEPGHCDPGEDETDTRMLLHVSVITIHSVVGIFIHSYYDYFPCESVFLSY